MLITELVQVLIYILVLIKIVLLIHSKGPLVIYQEIKNFIHLHKLPGPKRYILFGNVFETFADEATNFKKLRQWAQEYSPVYTIIAFPVCLVNLTRPEEVQKVLSTTKNTNKTFLYQFIQMLVEEGLVTSNGTKNQERRKLLDLSFHVNVLQQFITNFHQRSKKLTEDVEKSVKNGKNVIDVVPLLYIHGLEAVKETLMGVTVDGNSEENDNYAKALNYYVEIVPYRMKKPWLYNDFIYYNFTKTGLSEKKYIKIMHNYTKKVINNRIDELKTKPFKTTDGKHMPLLDLLINAKNEGKINWNGIKEEINSFMVGGTDTATNSMGFTLMLLANHGKIQEEIVEEINKIFPDPNEEISLQKLNELKLLERCIKESLRLYPSLSWISRTLDEDLITTNNYKLPKGSAVSVHIFDLHRNPEIFPDPERFDPDRFLPENCQKRHRYAYIPFSAGPRSCIGQRYATIEIKVFLMNILRKFKLEPVDTQKTLAIYGTVFLRVKNGIRVKFVPRNKC